ncbi:MAG: type II toxin-antitoxin system RelE/ParE family toxin [Eubacteriales bacterium]|nr:type II toxin-antitoxin system RelE/ParE family toxin [Eubacteriales bacterium]
MSWTIEFIREAQHDLKKLDPYNQKIILKAIDKTAKRPLPPPDGIGKPLGNHANSKLNGFLKIKLKALGYRVVYRLITEGSVMRIIVISIRDDEAVYKEAERRVKGLIAPYEL